MYIGAGSDLTEEMVAGLVVVGGDVVFATLVIGSAG
jgi:hypothetical protein